MFFINHFLLKTSVVSYTKNKTITQRNENIADSISSFEMEVGTLQDHPLSTLNSGTISKHDTEPPAVQVEDAASLQKPVFFNYHEFSERYYIDLNSSQYSEHSEDRGLCITHFPNVYVPKGSKEFADTRIVRIPRRFETTVDYPCFSTCLPGFEPAALIDETDADRFVPHGMFDNRQFFGYSSISPLNELFTEVEFENIVNPINEIIRRASRIYSWFNIFNMVADIITLGLWQWIFARHIIRDPMHELEDHIASLNETSSFRNRRVKIQSPRRSGYLSLDFQISTPSH